MTPIVLHSTIAKKTINNKEGVNNVMDDFKCTELH